MATESGLGYTLRPPKSYTAGRKSGQPSVLFIHTTEGSEGTQSAEDGAAYDARRTDGTSTHFFVDADSVVQCVRTTDEAHAARSHGNDVGIQIEVCGTAGQSAAQWADAASAGTLEQLARLCVKLRAQRPGRFPLVNLTPAQLAAGGRGFAEHYDATRAWPEDGGTHTDPGPNFPWARLFARITELESEDDMPTIEQITEAAEQGFRNAMASGYVASDQAGRNVRDQMRGIVGGPVDGAAIIAAVSKLDTVDEGALAAALGPVLIAGLAPAIIAGIGNGGTLTPDAVQNAVEIGVANVLQRAAAAPPRAQ